jgi:hypothetical protein
MRKGILIAALVVASPALAGSHGGGHAGGSRSFGGEHFTVAHTTKNGTHVQGHWSTDPNSTRNDNYSTRGDVNPHTGEAGTKPRDGESY